MHREDSFKRVVPTLASGADIHAKPIPSEIRTPTEYRPGGILAGDAAATSWRASTTACQAMASAAQRAEAVYDKALQPHSCGSRNHVLRF